ncbi:MAG TPA: cobalamin-independent methionine synthase II family protein [Candidatus Dormibacteraeota bacterium]|nr:cobalamin-independent methionine synthase II family protein [Candidatus Dormibacteraeota bacterium]
MNALRAEQVGSLLRPAPLLQARIDFFAGRLDRQGLREEEDRAILEALRRQRACGIDIVTDGEFRRFSFVSGFTDAVDGFVAAEAPPVAWRGGAGQGAPGHGRAVAAALRARGRIAEAESAFLRDHARGPFKVTLPSPLVLALYAHRPGLTDAVYRTPEDLIGDAARILAEEARQLAAEGVPYVQLDAPAYSQWIDPSLLASRWDGAVDVNRLLDTAIAADNRVLDAAGAGGATTAVHVCRGNSRGRWVVEGGYDRIAERLFTKLRCHRLLLEYDSARAGGFGPLRYLPGNKMAVLGLITTKTGELESRDDLLRRIDEASRIAPLEQLALSPQCGFASTQIGNPLTEGDQWRKLELVASVTREVGP